jgi:hypothetical protein
MCLVGEGVGTWGLLARVRSKLTYGVIYGGVDRGLGRWDIVWLSD